jgi:hypothetical protein
VVQRDFGMGRCLVGILLFPLIDRFFQMLDRFRFVRISLCLLTGFRVRERRLGMSS